MSGYGSAATNAANMAAKSNLFGGSSKAFGNYAGGASNVLGIYNGIKQGGVAGYSGAAANSAALGARAGAFGSYSGAVGQYAGYAAIPLAVYDFAKNGTTSGRTGDDAKTGAIDGATIGTAIMPGIGTVVGGVIGGAAGALASAFGNGAVDPENANFEGYTKAYNSAPAAQQEQVAASMKNPYLPLAGYFDLRSNQMKGQNPVYNTYGRLGEQKFTNDLISKVQQGKSQGISNPSQMWSSVVQPWINSMGTWQDSNKKAMTSLMQNMTGQVMMGTYKQNFQAIGGDSPFKSG